jgi:Flp pilus assembly protein TadD
VSLVVLLGVVRSASRETVWRNDYQLWTMSVKDAPRSFRVSHAVGDLLFLNGRTQEAIRIYDRAIEESVTPWKIRDDFARRLHEVGDDSAAVVQLRLSLAEKPDQPVAQIELATALIGEGDYAGARSVIERSIDSGDNAPVLGQLEYVADSAATHHLPPGSVHLTLHVEMGNALGGAVGTQPQPPQP